MATCSPFTDTVWSGVQTLAWIRRAASAIETAGTAKRAPQLLARKIMADSPCEWAGRTPTGALVAFSRPALCQGSGVAGQNAASAILGSKVVAPSQFRSATTPAGAKLTLEKARKCRWSKAGGRLLQRRFMYD